MFLLSGFAKIFNLFYKFDTRSSTLDSKETYAYPTVVIEMKDHQNPSHDPLMNERGNSSLFQYVSYQRQIRSDVVN